MTNPKCDSSGQAGGTVILQMHNACLFVCLFVSSYLLHSGLMQKGGLEALRKLRPAMHGDFQDSYLTYVWCTSASIKGWEERTNEHVRFAVAVNDVANYSPPVCIPFMCSGPPATHRLRLSPSLGREDQSNGELHGRLSDVLNLPTLSPSLHV